MKLFFSTLPRNLIDCFKGRRLVRHLSAITLTLLQTTMAGVTSSVSHSESVLMVSPLALDQIQGVIPLGNLNPVGGLVFPTDHIYIDYRHKAGLMVFAPAPGAVRSIRLQSRGDLKIEVQVDPNIDYYLVHLDLEPEIRVDSKVVPGQRLGRVSGKSMLDLGTTDARVRLTGLSNPSRYPESTLHAVSPCSRSPMMFSIHRQSEYPSAALWLRLASMP